MNAKEMVVGATQKFKTVPTVNTVDRVRKNKTSKRSPTKLVCNASVDVQELFEMMRVKNQHVAVLEPLIGLVTRRLVKYSKGLTRFKKQSPHGLVIFTMDKMTKKRLTLRPIFVPSFEREKSGTLRVHKICRGGESGSQKLLFVNFGSFDVEGRLRAFFESLFSGGIVASSTKPSFTKASSSVESPSVRISRFRIRFEISFKRDMSQTKRIYPNRARER